MVPKGFRGEGERTREPFVMETIQMDHVLSKPDASLSKIIRLCGAFLRGGSRVRSPSHYSLIEETPNVSATFQLKPL